MVERAPFPTATYNAWHHRGLPPEDTGMTSVGSGTPWGEYLRRFGSPSFSPANFAIC
jgi:hypothetical protein